MKISQTSTGSGPSVSIYFLATNCSNASNYPRFWQPFAASCAFRSSIFAGSGIRLRERQSFPAFLRKRQDPVQTARSTMDLCERFSNQCTMASRNRFAPLPWFGPYANLFLPVGNVASNLGMYVNTHFHLTKNPAESCILPFSIVYSSKSNKLFSYSVCNFLSANIYKY